MGCMRNFSLPFHTFITWWSTSPAGLYSTSAVRSLRMSVKIPWHLAHLHWYEVYPVVVNVRPLSPLNSFGRIVSSIKATSMCSSLSTLKSSTFLVVYPAIFSCRIFNFVSPFADLSQEPGRLQSLRGGLVTQATANLV